MPCDVWFLLHTRVSSDSCQDLATTTGSGATAVKILSLLPAHEWGSLQ